MLRHPAPLPPVPLSPVVPPTAKLIPPKPTLKLSRVTNGLLLVLFFWSWHSLFTFHMQDFHVSACCAFSYGGCLVLCELMQNDLCSEIAIKIDNKVLIAVVFHVSLQCFDTVGRVTGTSFSL